MDEIEKLRATIAEEQNVLDVYATVMSRHSGAPRAVLAAQRVREAQERLDVLERGTRGQ